MAETILIVDDTPANLGVLVETLGAAGYQLMVAEDGEEALAQTAQTHPDLILLDVMMPGIDGFETCRRFKEHPATRDIPVLFMTALSETADKVKAFAVGGVDYITKPIEHEEALARVRTHLALRHLRRELEEQLALKEKFMRIAGHDLRNPLCLIMLAESIASRTPGTPETVRQCLNNISHGTGQIRNIIDTFLDLRSAQSGGAVLDLALLASAVVRQHTHAATDKKLSLTTELGASPALVRGEQTLAYQIITNIVNNALKFTPHGGRVVVRLRVGDAFVRVEVADTGPGVPAAERSLLFTENARLSPRPTGGEESHGFGLSIVKHLAESLGGSVGAEFPTTGGSIFWFELPTTAKV